MAKYLFVYYGGMGATTPTARQKSMAAWVKWFEKMGKAVVEMGAPTMPGKMVRKSGARAIRKEPITGYSIIKADDLAAAVEMAKGCPSIPEGGSVAVYETFAM